MNPPIRLPVDVVNDDAKWVHKGQGITLVLSENKGPPKKTVVLTGIIFTVCGWLVVLSCFFLW